MAQQLRMQLLSFGTPEVRIWETPVIFPTRKTQALLFYLAIEGGPQPREQLATLFWPNSSASLSRASLRNTLNRLLVALRNACGGVQIPFLEVNNTSISLNEPDLIDLDLKTVERAYRLAGRDWSSLTPGESTDAMGLLESAFKYARGDFLAGFSLGDAPGFDEWLSMQREDWQRRLGSILDRLSELQFSRGDFSKATQTASKWISIDPYNEAAYRRKMRIHFAAGDRAKALESYDLCREVLMSELGIEPEPDTDALAERIRAQVSPHHTRLIYSIDQTTRSATSVNFLGSLFTGRNNENQMLVNSFNLASSGQPQVVILRGEAGIGKTRLAEKFIAWAVAQGSDVIRGDAFESSSHFPFLPLVDAIRSRLQGEKTVLEKLDEVWASGLAQLLPELRPNLPALTVGTLEPSTLEADLSQTQLFEAMVQFTLTLASQATLVMLIDDLQWADSASLDWLLYAIRRWQDRSNSIPQARILLLVSLRVEGLFPVNPTQLDEGQSTLLQWLTQVEREITPVQIDLEPLAELEAVQMVQSILLPPSEEFARWLYAETHGHPFYLIETLKDLLERRVLRPKRQPDGHWTFSLNPRKDLEEEARIPSTIYSVIRSRLNRLSPNAFSVLAAAAVLEQQLTFEHLTLISNVSEEMALPALDELISGRLLLESEEPGFSGEYIFVNDMLRDVVYTEAGDERRRLFHRRALEMLDSEKSSAAVLAHHALASGLVQEAFRYSLEAGREALRLSAVRDAVVHLERAFELVKNGSLNETPSENDLKELFKQLGHAYKRSGRPEKALELDHEQKRLFSEFGQID